MSQMNLGSQINIFRCYTRIDKRCVISSRSSSSLISTDKKRPQKGHPLMCLKIVNTYLHEKRLEIIRKHKSLAEEEKFAKLLNF